MPHYVLGITGKIAAGKTTVGKLFEALGAKRIDADAIVDQLYRPGEIGWKKIRQFFGEQYCKKDHTIDRKKLARDIFHDPRKVRMLNTLIHPMVYHEIRTILQKERAPFTVIEATYFTADCLGKLMTELLVITAPKSEQEKRIRKRGLSDKLFRQMQAYQSAELHSQYTIENNGTKEALSKKVKSLYNRLVP